jgi:hypothetical protein
VASEARSLQLDTRAHDGYRDGELPRYQQCAHGCGQTVRADRLDLLREHDETCVALLAGVRDVGLVKMGRSAHRRRDVVSVACCAAGSGSSLRSSRSYAIATIEPAATPSAAESAG